MTPLLCVLAIVPVAWVSWMFLWPPFPRIFGWKAWRLGLAGLAWCLGTIALWIWLPRWLPAPALVGLGLGGFLARGRALALLAKGPLPPGSMSFAAGVRGMASRRWYLEQSVRLGPVFKASQFGRPVLCVVGMERICQLMRGHSADLGPSSVAFTESIPGGFLRYMDDSTHSKYGGLFRRALAGDVGGGTEEEHRRRARRMLSELATQGAVCPAGPLETHVRRALDFVLFGMRGDDARSVRFGVLSEEFSRAAMTRRPTPSEMQLVEEMERLAMEHLEDGSASASGFQAATARLRSVDPAMPDRLSLDNLVFMHRIATENVSALMVWLAYCWGTERAVVARIRELRGAERLAALEAFLAETLRLSQSEYLYRRVIREFEFEGFRFPKGWLVRSCIWESHRTTGALPAPEEFRLRLGPEDYDRGHYSPFGMGRHACNGVEVNRLLCMAFLQELADGFDLRMEGTEPFQRSMRHWGHWHVNSGTQMRVEVIR